MSRFPSFNHVPSETRWILRDRFASKLRVVRQGRFLDPDLKVTPDQLVLRLLAGLKVSIKRRVADSRNRLRRGRTDR